MKLDFHKLYEMHFKVITTMELIPFFPFFPHFLFHSLIHFVGAGITIPDWDFLGSTIITNNYIRLTPDEQSKQGAIWNTVV